MVFRYSSNKCPRHQKENKITDKDMERAVSHYLERKRIVEKSIKFMELDMKGENE